MNENLKKNELSLAAQAPADQLPAVVGDPGANALMGAVLAAASNPAVDADKMEKLLGMYKEIEAGEAKKAYTRALVKMMPELPAIERKGKIQITDKNDRTKIIQSTPYALWEDLHAVIMPILNRHGFALTFRTGIAHDGKVTVTGVLSHEGGHSEETTMTLPHDSTGSKNQVQAVGSTTSYGKRYTATLLLNIRTKGEDDDGMASDADAKIDDGQVKTIRDLLEDTGGNIEQFCDFMKVESVPDIAKGDYHKAIKAINEAHQARKAKARREANKVAAQ